MEINMQHAPWGLFMAAMMYVVGNGVWVNHLVREKHWLGWLLWLGACALVLLSGAAVESRLDMDPAGIWERLTRVDPENHWIMLGVFATMSVPGAASVILHQNSFWTRVAIVVVALLVFIPAGMQFNSPDGSNVIAGIVFALAVSGLMLAWQVLLDGEDEDEVEPENGSVTGEEG